MKLVNPELPVTSRWLRSQGYRLDAQPFITGAIEARVLLEKLAARKDPLHTLTAGFNGGIYNGPVFSRTYVDSPEHGVPFVGSSSMLMADLSDLPLLSKKLAYSSRLSHLELKENTTLISCSGTIGRMVYVRPEMAGMWSSQHIMKVVPDPDRVLPGYLYAFLSSRFGVPLVTSGTYGAIIQHIEPEHIADLPVPRLSGDVERAIHSRILEHARALSEHSRLLEAATKQTLELVGVPDLSDLDWLEDEARLGWRDTTLTHESFRALNYDPRARRLFRASTSGQWSQLGPLCVRKHFRGKIMFKRVDAEPEYGRLLVGQKAAFQIRPDGRWISRASVRNLGLQVPKGTTLIPSHGTLGEQELYCRAVYVTDRTSEYAFSGDFFRCIPIEAHVSPGYLFAFLRSRPAFRMLRSISTGGKQQEQHQKMMERFPIPRLKPEQEREIAAMVDEAARQFDNALSSEDAAQRLLEEEIGKLRKD